MSIAQGEDAGDFTQHLPSFAELNRFTSYNISFYPTLTLLTYLTSWFLTTGGSFFFTPGAIGCFHFVGSFSTKLLIVAQNREFHLSMSRNINWITGTAALSPPVKSTDSATLFCQHKLSRP